MRLVFALVAVVALVVGCTPEAVESPTPTPSPVETTVTPSESPTVEPPSPSPSPSPTVFQSYPADLPTEDPETAAIIEGWQEYQRVVEKFSKDPDGYTDTELVETQEVTWGVELRTVINRILALRENDLEYLGGTAFRDIAVGEYGADSEGLRTVTLTYCLDVSRAQLRNTLTDDVIDREGTFIEEALMTEGPDGIWRVTELRAESATC